MGFYSKFTEQDLIESYKNQIDYQDNATKELIDENFFQISFGRIHQ